jgi:2,4-dienoyl-CoA reductase-like NADH-dependent reductase (Old Yellow Enzyme family)/thioredoxin reductase
MENYPNLFKKITLAGRTVRNRIVMASMGDNMGNADGSVSEQAIAYYAARAKGGAGIIIPGVVSVEYPRGKTTPCQERLDEFKFVKGYARLAQAVHQHGALILPQIHHAGSSTDLATTEGVIPICVSAAILNKELPVIASNTEKNRIENHEISTEEVKELEQKYIQAALFAKLADCDGVELHGAHGYLIAQFLHSGINQRGDEYGGSIRNRARFPENIIKGIRAACGRDFIIGIRMPVHNWETDGLTDEESREMAVMFEKAGCDYLNISGGFTPTITNLLETQRYGQGDRLVLAEKIHGSVNIPIMAAGLLREPDFCEQAIADGKVEFALLARALLTDPEWPNKARTGRANEIRRCISCLDACYGNLAKGKSIQCVLNPEVGAESELCCASESSGKKRVIVVGGGLAGMQAAIKATQRGHDVTLLEKSSGLGGQLLLAAKAPHKGYINWAVDWFKGEMERLNIDTRLNNEAVLESIKSFSPDAVIMAAGAEPIKPPFEGGDNGIQAWDVLSGVVPIPKDKRVVVIGGGIVGCETAELLYENGCSVTILEMLDEFAIGLEAANKIDMISSFKEKGIEVLTGRRVNKIENNQVFYSGTEGSVVIEAEAVVFALGQKSCAGVLADQLESVGIHTITVGDAIRPAKFINATNSAYFAALYL